MWIVETKTRKRKPWRSARVKEFADKSAAYRYAKGWETNGWTVRVRRAK